MTPRARGQQNDFLRSTLSLRCSSILLGLLAGVCILFSLSGCGSGTTASAPAGAADFSITASPAALTLVPGGAAGQVSLGLASLNGFAAPVSMVITGLPAGVAASPASFSIAPGATQVLSLTAGAGAVAANAVITVTGTAGSLTHSVTVALTIAAPVAPPDFSLSAVPGSLSITGGAAGATTSLSVTSANGFSSNVNVAITGLPAGVTASPGTLSLVPGASQIVTLAATANAGGGTSTITFTGTAGALSHTSTVALTVIAGVQPDFSLTVSPSTLMLTTGAAGQQTSVSVGSVSGFAAPVNVSVSGLPAGVTVTPATLMVTPDAAQPITFTAAAGAAIVPATVTITGTSGTVQHTATAMLTIGAAPAAAVDATTYHFDNARTGLNPNETILTPANVRSSSFGKLRLLATDGKVDGEPLYLSSININAQTHNVLYAVSEHDSIYAFDADSGAQLWKVSALGSGETTSDAHSCGQITPEIGITSTPVIDRHFGDHGAIFVVAMSKDSTGAYHQRLHALDVTTGLELAGSPAEIAGSYPGSGDNSTGGMVTFAPGQYAERVGLLLMNQTLYLGWTSHCDQRPYTGWVMGYSENTLQQTQLLNLTPNGSEGSIWMSGAGMAADTSGNIFLLDANGTLDTSLDANGFPANADFGNAILKLSTANGKLSVADFFEPFNTVAESNADIDLGSGGALLLPDQTDSAGTVRHLLVGAGKDKNIYVADRDHLGKFNPADNSNVYQQISNALPGGAWSMPAYFNNTVFYGGVGDVLRAFAISNAKLSTTATSTSATHFGYPGTTPSISANGTSNGIVWAVESGTGSAAVLHAYNAANLADELYTSNQAPNGRDSFGNGNKFITPNVVSGRVYIGTPSGVAVFGLLTQP